jgi:DNA-binding Xre family transcriptional regulator
LLILTLCLTFLGNRGEEDSMSKKLTAIPEGNLLRVAATKSVTTLTDLKEKTGVDRKTLRAINTGKAVKEATLQTVADRLRVPLAHLVGANQSEKHQVSISGEYHYREIPLQRLDATGLRRIADETGKITWLLKIDHMSEELEALLMRLEKSLDGWSHHSAVMVFEPQEQIKLTDQISAVKTSADIDKIVEELAQKKLKIYGGTFVHWTKELPRNPDDDYHPLTPTLKYTSRHTAGLCVAPEGKNISTVKVATGYEPPQEFADDTLTDVDIVKIDGRQVWSRPKAEKSKNDDYDDNIPF